MSSSSHSNSSAEAPGTSITVFVDIPDPDNIHMIIYLLRYYNGPISIVLSPRAVDLRAPRYGSEFTTLSEACDGDINKLCYPIRTEEELSKRLSKVSPAYEKWFYIDEDCNTTSVREDSELYMDVSTQHVMYVLDQQGFPRDAYQIYWDETSLKIDQTATTQRFRLGTPAMRHAFHVHDFKYYFDESEKKQYQQITADAPERRLSNTLRGGLRGLLQRHRARMHEELGSPESTFRPLTDFSKSATKNGAEHEFVIGGPFTEVLSVLKHEIIPTKVTAMVGSLGKGINVFPNQFNLHADLDSGTQVLRYLQKSSIRTDIIPTDSVKQPDIVCTGDNLKEGFRSNLFRGMVHEYLKDTGDKKDWYNFDGLTAIAHCSPELFDWTPAASEWWDSEKDKQLKDRTDALLGTGDKDLKDKYIFRPNGMRMGKAKDLPPNEKFNIWNMMESCLWEDGKGLPNYPMEKLTLNE
jgi:hypothetical protein